MHNDAALLAGCMGNAALIQESEMMIKAAGFENVHSGPKDESREFIRDRAPVHNVTGCVLPATTEGVKPGCKPGNHAADLAPASPH